MAKTTSAQVFSRSYEYDDGTVVLAIDRNDVAESVDSDVAILEDEVYDGNMVDFGVYLTVYRRGQNNPSEFIFDISGMDMGELEHTDTVTNNGIVSVWFEPSSDEEPDISDADSEESEDDGSKDS